MDVDELDDMPLAQRAVLQLKRDEESSLKRKREEEDLKLAKKVSLGLRHGGGGGAAAASGAGASDAAAKKPKPKPPAATGGGKAKVGTVKAGVAKPKPQKKKTKTKTKTASAPGASPPRRKTTTGAGREDATVKWRTLEHHGVVFPELYEPHGVKPLYDGRPLELLPEEEEAATHYAVMLETDYVTKPRFIENFWRDFRAILRAELRGRVVEFAKMDFRPIFEWHKRRVEERKNVPREEKKRAKEAKDELERKYTTAVIDGKVRRELPPSQRPTRSPAR